MKPILILLFFSLLFMNVAAQKKDIRIDFGWHRNIPERFFYSPEPTNNPKNEGNGFHIYANWMFTRHFNFGINMETTKVVEDPYYDVIGFFRVNSIVPTARYYFLEHQVGPYLGLGIGSYQVERFEPFINLGLRAAIGFSISDYFNFSFEYNRLFFETERKSALANPFSNYYVALKGSVSIGMLQSKRNSGDHSVIDQH